MLVAGNCTARVAQDELGGRSAGGTPGKNRSMSRWVLQIGVHSYLKNRTVNLLSRHSPPDSLP